MGMFDDVKLEIKCPECGEVVNRFQSKDGECVLAELDFWEVDNFYDYCEKCGAFIEFTLKDAGYRKLQEVRKSFTLADYDMHVRKKEKDPD